MLNPTLNVLDGDSSEEDEVITTGDKTQSTSLIAQTVVQTKAIKPVLLQLPDNEDDDDEEDAPLPGAALTDDLLESEGLSTVVQSEECTEALQAVESDCWDVNSWILFIDEVEGGRGGSISVPDAYNRFLDKFPRAAKQWKALAEHHIQLQEHGQAEDVFNKCLSKCRNVELWQSYIHMVRLKSPIDGSQKMIEAAFEKALDNIGMSISSNTLWAAYIEFIRSWPETDAGKKLGNSTE